VIDDRTVLVGRPCHLELELRVLNFAKLPYDLLAGDSHLNYVFVRGLNMSRQPANSFVEARELLTQFRNRVLHSVNLAA
jgi:hypothetical protein